MKPHPSIFEAALRAVDVEPREAVMVGDSLRTTSRARGASACARSSSSRSAGAHASCPPDVPVIESLRELPALLSLPTPFTR